MPRPLPSGPGPPTQEPRREEKESSDELDEPLEDRSYDPERDREEPEEGIGDERQQRERPADEEEEEPEEELHHIVS